MANKIKWKINIKKTDIIIFLIVILIFSANLLGFFPGFLTPDSVAQLEQAINNDYTDAHPVLHSFIIGKLLNIFNSVAAVGGFQIILFAIVWTYACHVTRKDNNCFTVRFIQIILTILICIMPINYVLSITVWKDIIFSYTVLALILYIYVGIKKKYNFSIIDIIFLCISAVLTMKIRHNGLAISLIIIPLLIILNLIKTKKITNTLKFLSVFVIIFILFSLPEWLCNVRKTVFESDLFNSARLYAMGALLQNDIELELEEEEFLNKILPTEEWAKSYNQFHALNIFYNKQYDANYLIENEDKFIEIFDKYAKQNPKVIYNHFLYLNSIAWSVPELGRMTTFTTSNSYISEMSGGLYQNEPKVQAFNTFFGNIINETTTNKTLYTILYRPAVPMYISIIITLVLSIKRKRLDYILLLFPMFLNIGVYIIMLPSQDLRYYYPNFMTSYFLILILFENIKVKKTAILEKNINKEYGKTLTIIPAYNEAENIQKVLDELKKDFPETDILVINDCSKDNTKEIVISNNINCITTTFNLNYAYAVQTGIKYAKKYDYDYCLMFDGDGQHIAKEAKKLLDKIKESNCDIVIGSRYLEKGNYKSPKLRKIGTSFFIWLIKLSCHTKISDPLSGFQVINKRVIEKYSRMGEYPEFPDANLIIEMLLDGYTIEEVSVKMRNREFGESMHGGIIKPIKYMVVMLYTIVILILNKLFGRRK